MIDFTIKGRMIGLNDYTRRCRGNKYGGNTIKHEMERMVSISVDQETRNKISDIKDFPISIEIFWREPNSRRDIDNITFATKFILDALVKHCGLPDDNQKYINDIRHHVTVDKENPGIRVILHTN